MLVIVRTETSTPSRFAASKDAVIWGGIAPYVANHHFGRHAWLLEVDAPADWQKGKYYYTLGYGKGEIPSDWKMGKHKGRPHVCFRLGLVKKIWYLGEPNVELTDMPIKKLSKSYIPGSTFKGVTKVITFQYPKINTGVIVAAMATVVTGMAVATGVLLSMNPIGGLKPNPVTTTSTPTCTFVQVDSGDCN